MQSDTPGTYFLPSEICRLVLGFLKEQKYTETCKCFVKECSHLTEYESLRKKGMEGPTRIMGLSLVMILEEYARLKLQGSECVRSPPGRVTTIVNQLESVVSTLKSSTVPYTLLPPQGSGVRILPRRGPRQRGGLPSRCSPFTRSFAQARSEGVPSHTISQLPGQPSLISQPLSPASSSNGYQDDINVDVGSHSSASSSAPRVQTIAVGTIVPGSNSIIVQRTDTPPTGKGALLAHFQRKGAATSTETSTTSDSQSSVVVSGNASCNQTLASTTQSGSNEVYCDLTPTTPLRTSGHSSSHGNKGSRLHALATTEQLPSRPSSQHKSSESMQLTSNAPCSSDEDSILSGALGVDCERSEHFSSKQATTKRKKKTPRRRSEGVAGEGLGAGVKGLDKIINSNRFVKTLVDNINRSLYSSQGRAGEGQGSGEDMDRGVPPQAPPPSTSSLATEDSHLEELLNRDHQNMSESAMKDIIEMTRNDPVFDGLFDIFNADREEFIQREFGRGSKPDNQDQPVPGSREGLHTPLPDCAPYYTEPALESQPAASSSAPASASAALTFSTPFIDTSSMAGFPDRGDSAGKATRAAASTGGRDSQAVKASTSSDAVVVEGGMEESSCPRDKELGDASGQAVLHARMLHSEKDRGERRTEACNNGREHVRSSEMNPPQPGTSHGGGGSTAPPAAMDSEHSYCQRSGGKGVPPSMGEESQSSVSTHHDSFHESPYRLAMANCSNSQSSGDANGPIALDGTAFGAVVIRDDTRSVVAVVEEPSVRQSDGLAVQGGVRRLQDSNPDTEELCEKEDPKHLQLPEETPQFSQGNQSKFCLLEETHLSNDGTELVDQSPNQSSFTESQVTQAQMPTQECLPCSVESQAPRRVTPAPHRSPAQAPAPFTHSSPLLPHSHPATSPSPSQAQAGCARCLPRSPLAHGQIQLDLPQQGTDSPRPRCDWTCLGLDPEAEDARCQQRTESLGQLDAEDAQRQHRTELHGQLDSEDAQCHQRTESHGQLDSDAAQCQQKTESHGQDVEAESPVPACVSPVMLSPGKVPTCAPSFASPVCSIDKAAVSGLNSPSSPLTEAAVATSSNGNRGRSQIESIESSSHTELETSDKQFLKKQTSVRSDDSAVTARNSDGKVYSRTLYRKGVSSARRRKKAFFLVTSKKAMSSARSRRKQSKKKSAPPAVSGDKAASAARSGCKENQGVSATPGEDGGAPQASAFLQLRLALMSRLSGIDTIKKGDSGHLQSKPAVPSPARELRPGHQPSSPGASVSVSLQPTAASTHGADFNVQPSSPGPSGEVPVADGSGNVNPNKIPESRNVNPNRVPESGNVNPNRIPEAQFEQLKTPPRSSSTRHSSRTTTPQSIGSPPGPSPQAGPPRTPQRRSPATPHRSHLFTPPRRRSSLYSPLKSPRSAASLVQRATPKRLLNEPIPEDMIEEISRLSDSFQSSPCMAQPSSVTSSPLFQSVASHPYPLPSPRQRQRERLSSAQSVTSPTSPAERRARPMPRSPRTSKPSVSRRLLELTHSSRSGRPSTAQQAAGSERVGYDSDTQNSAYSAQTELYFLSPRGGSQTPHHSSRLPSLPQVQHEAAQERVESNGEPVLNQAANDTTHSDSSSRSAKSNLEQSFKAVAIMELAENVNLDVVQNSPLDLSSKQQSNGSSNLGDTVPAVSDSAAIFSTHVTVQSEHQASDNPGSEQSGDSGGSSSGKSSNPSTRKSSGGFTATSNSNTFLNADISEETCRTNISLPILPPNVSQFLADQMELGELQVPLDLTTDLTLHKLTTPTPTPTASPQKQTLQRKSPTKPSSKNTPKKAKASPRKLLSVNIGQFASLSRRSSPREVTERSPQKRRLKAKARRSRQKPENGEPEANSRKASLRSARHFASLSLPEQQSQISPSGDKGKEDVTSACPTSSSQAKETGNSTRKPKARAPMRKSEAVKASSANKGGKKRKPVSKTKKLLEVSESDDYTIFTESSSDLDDIELEAGGKPQEQTSGNNMITSLSQCGQDTRHTSTTLPTERNVCHPSAGMSTDRDDRNTSTDMSTERDVTHVRAAASTEEVRRNRRGTKSIEGVVRNLSAAKSSEKDIGDVSSSRSTEKDLIAARSPEKDGSPAKSTEPTPPASAVEVPPGTSGAAVQESSVETMVQTVPRQDVGLVGCGSPLPAVRRQPIARKDLSLINPDAALPGMRRPGDRKDTSSIASLYEEESSIETPDTTSTESDSEDSGEEKTKDSEDEKNEGSDEENGKDSEEGKQPPSQKQYNRNSSSSAEVDICDFSDDPDDILESGSEIALVTSQCNKVKETIRAAKRSASFVKRSSQGSSPASNKHNASSSLEVKGSKQPSNISPNTKKQTEGLQRSPAGTPKSSKTQKDRKKSLKRKPGIKVYQMNASFGPKRHPSGKHTAGEKSPSSANRSKSESRSKSPVTPSKGGSPAHSKHSNSDISPKLGRHPASPTKGQGSGGERRSPRISPRSKQTSPAVAASQMSETSVSQAHNALLSAQGDLSAASADSMSTTTNSRQAVATVGWGQHNSFQYVSVSEPASVGIEKHGPYRRVKPIMLSRNISSHFAAMRKTQVSSSLFPSPSVSNLSAASPVVQPDEQSSGPGSSAQAAFPPPPQPQSGPATTTVSRVSISLCARGASMDKSAPLQSPPDNLASLVPSATSTPFFFNAPPSKVSKPQLRSADSTPSYLRKAASKSSAETSFSRLSSNILGSKSTENVSGQLFPETSGLPSNTSGSKSFGETVIEKSTVPSRLDPSGGKLRQTGDNVSSRTRSSDIVKTPSVKSLNGTPTSKTSASKASDKTPVRKPSKGKNAKSLKKSKSALGEEDAIVASQATASSASKKHSPTPSKNRRQQQQQQSLKGRQSSGKRSSAVGNKTKKPQSKSSTGPSSAHAESVDEDSPAGSGNQAPSGSGNGATAEFSPQGVGGGRMEASVGGGRMEASLPEFDQGETEQAVRALLELNSSESCEASRFAAAGVNRVCQDRSRDVGEVVPTEGGIHDCFPAETDGGTWEAEKQASGVDSRPTRNTGRSTSGGRLANVGSTRTVNRYTGEGVPGPSNSTVAPVSSQSRSTDEAKRTHRTLSLKRKAQTKSSPLNSKPTKRVRLNERGAHVDASCADDINASCADDVDASCADQRQEGTVSRGSHQQPSPVLSMPFIGDVSMSPSKPKHCPEEASLLSAGNLLHIEDNAPVPPVVDGSSIVRTFSSLLNQVETGGASAGNNVLPLNSVGILNTGVQHVIINLSGLPMMNVVPAVGSTPVQPAVDPQDSKTKKGEPRMRKAKPTTQSSSSTSSYVTNIAMATNNLQFRPILPKNLLLYRNNPNLATVAGTSDSSVAPLSSPLKPDAGTSYLSMPVLIGNDSAADGLDPSGSAVQPADVSVPSDHSGEESTPAVTPASKGRGKKSRSRGGGKASDKDAGGEPAERGPPGKKKPGTRRARRAVLQSPAQPNLASPQPLVIDELTSKAGSGAGGGAKGKRRRSATGGSGDKGKGKKRKKKGAGAEDSNTERNIADRIAAEFPSTSNMSWSRYDFQSALLASSKKKLPAETSAQDIFKTMLTQPVVAPEIESDASVMDHDALTALVPVSSLPPVSSPDKSRPQGRATASNTALVPVSSLPPDSSPDKSRPQGRATASTSNKKNPEGDNLVPETENEVQGQKPGGPASQPASVVVSTEASVVVSTEASVVVSTAASKRSGLADSPSTTFRTPLSSVQEFLHSQRGSLVSQAFFPGGESPRTVQAAETLLSFNDERGTPQASAVVGTPPSASSSRTPVSAVVGTPPSASSSRTPVSAVVGTPPSASSSRTPVSASPVDEPLPSPATDLDEILQKADRLSKINIDKLLDKKVHKKT